MVDIMQVAKILLYCSMYMIIGPALILVNKYILRDLEFKYPMFLSGLGMLVTGAVAHVAVASGQTVLDSSKCITRSFWISNILPVGAGTALAFTFGNGAYMYLTVAFIQMLKAFTPTVVLIMLKLFGIDEPTKEVVASVVVISVGTAVSSFGEMHMVWLGFFMMCLAELSEGTRLVLQQKMLQNLKFGVVEGQYYMAPASAACLFLGSLVFEVPSMVTSGDYNIILDHPLLFFLAGTLGLGINMAGFLVIKSTSSVTIKILGTVRNCLLVLFTVFAQGEQVSSMQFTGYAITLTGFSLYNYYKITQKKHAPPNVQPDTESGKGNYEMVANLDKLQGQKGNG